MEPLVEMNPRHIGNVADAFGAGTVAAGKLRPLAALGRFGRDAGGVVTVWAIGWTVVFLMIGGLAIDSGNSWKELAVLQATADAAALAGSIDMYALSSAAMKAEAIRIADLNQNQRVLRAADVVTGKWNMRTRTFNPNALLHDAVQVVTRRTSGLGNAVPTFLLKLVGFTSWDVAATATAQRFLPGCIKDGIVARNTVQISSNNAFVKGYCVHGQNGVQVSSNNSFEGPSADIPGVIVSMNDLADFQMPTSAYSSSPGLKNSLRENFMNPKVVDHIAEYIANFTNMTWPRMPGYINKSLPVINISKATFARDVRAMEPGRVYKVTCPSNGSNDQMSIVFTANTTLRDVVLVTNCRITNTAKVSVLNSVMISSNTATNAITAGFSWQVGVDDNCAKGGGSLILAKGGIDIAAASEIYGSMLVSAADIRIVALAGGIEGASFQSGRDFKLTSNAAFGNCTGNVDEIVYEDYYRLVD